MLRDGRKTGFRTVTVGGAVLGLFAVPLRRRLKRVELTMLPQARHVQNVHSHRFPNLWARKLGPAILRGETYQST